MHVRQSMIHPRTVLPVLLLAGAVVAAASCYQPDDTLVNINAGADVSSSGSGGMGTSSSNGAGAGAPATAKAYFIEECLPGLLKTCGDGNCHVGSDQPFLAGNSDDERYNSITGYDPSVGTSLIVKDASASLLMTHPYEADGHKGSAQWDDPGLEGLRATVLQWLTWEAENVVDDPVIEVGPVKPNNLTTLDLSDLGADFVGSAISFYASEYDGLLELDSLQIYPKAGVGLRVKNITLVVYPPKGAEALVDEQLHGEPVSYVAPTKVTVGGGQAVLPQWINGSKLSFRFDSIEVLYADSAGNTFTFCNDVKAFRQAVDALPYQSAENQPNGLRYCAKTCHGGNGTTPTAVMDLSPLNLDPPNDEAACAVARSFITPGSVNNSRLVLATKPAPENDAHVAFRFGGNLSAHDAFTASVTAWIQAEGGL
jgi:hypothetical protein